MNDDYLYMDAEERALLQEAEAISVEAGTPNIRSIRSAYDAAYERAQASATTAQWSAEQPIRDRNEVIEQMIYEGFYTPEEINQHVVVNTEPDYSGVGDFRPKTDYAALAIIAKQRGADMYDDAELNEIIRQQLNQEYTEQEKILSSTAGMGATVGKLAGYLGGAMADPINIPLMIMPGVGVGAAGMTVGKTIAKVTAYEAALGAATEAGLNQFAHKPFREKYGLDSQNNLSAALQGGVAGAVGGALFTGPITAYANRGLRSRAIEEAAGGADDVGVEPSPGVIGEDYGTIRDTPEVIRLRDIQALDPASDEYANTISAAYDALPDGVRGMELDDAGTTPSVMVQKADDELARLQGFQACMLGGD
jgi:hypothetical protein